jgi:hypothetical protein
MKDKIEVIKPDKRIIEALLEVLKQNTLIIQYLSTAQVVIPKDESND